MQQAQKQTQPRTPAELPPALSRDLISIADFSMVTMAPKPFSNPAKELRINAPLAKESDPQELVRSWIFAIKDELTGFPIAGDQDVYVAIQYYLQESAFDSRWVRCTRADVCRILGWTPDKRRYDQILFALRRFRNVTYRADNIFIDREDSTRYGSIEFGFVDAFAFGDRPPKKHLAAQGELPLNYIRISDEYLALCRHQHHKMIDLDFYRSLSRPEVRWLYRFLDKNLHSKPQFRIGVRKLRARQGMLDPLPDKKIIYKHRRRFQELKDAGYLADFKFIKTTNHNDPWHVVVTPGPLFFASKGKRSRKHIDPIHEAERLSQGHITPNMRRSADDLVRSWRTCKGFPVEGPITRSDRKPMFALLKHLAGDLELAHFAVAYACRHFSDMKNPAGVLESNYPERARQEYMKNQVDKEAAQDGEQARARQIAEQEREHEELERAWRALPDEEREQLLIEARYWLRKTVKNVTQWSEETFERTATLRAKKELTRRLTH